jgi:tetratricopeptide (TPR) repeat protein
MAVIRSSNRRKLDWKIGQLATERATWPEAFSASGYCLRWGPVHLLVSGQASAASRLLGETGFLAEHIAAHEDELAPIAIWRCVPGAAARLRRIAAAASTRTGLEWAYRAARVAAFLRDAGYVRAYGHLVRAAREGIPRALRARSRIAHELDYEGALADLHNGAYEQARNRLEALVRKRRLEDLRPEILNNLGGACLEVGDVAAAKRHFSKSVAEALARDGTGTRVATTARRGLANAIAARGESQKAIALLVELLADEESANSPDALSSLATRASLAAFRADLADGAASRQRALNELRAVQRDFAAILGRSHPQTLVAKWNLATSLDDFGNEDEALTLLGDVLRRREDTFGADHPDTIASTRYFASALARSGKRAPAIQLLRANIPRAGKVWGERDEGTLDQKLQLGRLLLDGRGLPERNEGERILAAIARVRPTTSDVADVVVESLVRLGYASAETGDLRVAEASFRRASRVATRTPRCAAHLRADALEGVARVLVRLSRPKAAVGQFKAAIRVADQQREQNARQRIELRRCVAVILRDLGRHGEAARWFRASLRLTRAQPVIDAAVEEKILSGLARTAEAAAAQRGLK